MTRIVISSRYDRRMKLDYLVDMLSLRYQTFCERLCWSVNSRGGMEFDTFDDQDPVYMVALNQQDRVEGCWRMMPTTRSNMLRDVFPQLCSESNMPQSKDVWEISRWATVPCESEKYYQAAVNPVTIDMISAAYDYAKEKGITEFVVVTSAAMERLMKRLGLPITRLGDSVRIEKVLSVACRIPVNEEYAQALCAIRKGHLQWKTAA